MLRRPLVLLFLSLVLASCSGRPDETAPLIGVVSPAGGAVAKGKALVVEGYAFDDTGVVSVRAGETEVLPEGDRGKKLVGFRFRLEAPQAGEVRVNLVARDAAGHERKRELRLVLDQSPPSVKLERVEVEDGRLRIVGSATDDVEVDRVVVRYGKTYSRLNLPKGKVVRFYVEVPAERATVIAVDAVGRRTEAAARP